MMTHFDNVVFNLKNLSTESHNFFNAIFLITSDVQDKDKFGKKELLEFTFPLAFN